MERKRKGVQIPQGPPEFPEKTIGGNGKKFGRQVRTTGFDAS